jgi:hypothetical protein
VFAEGDRIGIQAFAARGAGGVESVGSPPVEVTVRGGGCVDARVDFEEGFWPLPGWEVIAAGGEVTFEGYWGDFSLVDPNWHWSPGIGSATPGTIISGTLKPGERAYIGFDSSAGGTKSLVVAPNTGDIRFQDNPDYGYTELNIVPVDLDEAGWYTVEIEFLDANRVEGRVFTAAGEPVASIEQDYAAYGGIRDGSLALRGFGGAYFDEIFIRCP